MAHGVVKAYNKLLLRQIAVMEWVTCCVYIADIC